VKNITKAASKKIMETAFPIRNYTWSNNHNIHN